MVNNSKLIRITTVPISLEKLLENQLGFMKDYYDVTAVSADKKTLNEFGKRKELNTYHIALTRKITPIQDIKAVFKLYKFLKKENPQIVHTHTPKAGIVGMLASYVARVPFRLHTVAGLPLLEANGIKRVILNMVEKLTYACATKVYPNSYGLKQIIKTNKFTSESKLKVIANGSSNGINTSHFDSSLFSKEDSLSLMEAIGIKENDFVFIFVGRIVSDKGINELVIAFNDLFNESQRKNIKLLLVGHQERELDPLSNETLTILDKNTNIISVGYQQDVRPYFAISDALIFPSYREGFPNVVMQAGAMGLPSIVSNINGCNEIIKDEENGVIIPVKDSESIYKAMKRLLDEPELKNRLQKNARNMITELYEQKIVWEALLKEYKSLEDNV